MNGNNNNIVSIVGDITIQWTDQTTTLSYDVEKQVWTRIVRGTPTTPCFAVTTMTIQDMITQLNALKEAVIQQWMETQQNKEQK